MGYQCVDCVAAARRDTVTHASTLLRRQAPYVTYALLAVNIAVFAVTAVQAHDLEHNDESALFRDWALWPPAVAHGQLSRLFGGAFLHFGPVHLVANMFALYVIGPMVEAALGSARYAALYTASILGSGAAVMMFSPGGVTAGASGAIFGLFGAQAAVVLKLRLPAGPVIGIIVLNLIITFSVPGISVWGHVGGLVAGAVAGFGMLYGPDLLNLRGSAARAATWVPLLAVAAVSAVLIALRIVRLSVES